MFKKFGENYRVCKKLSFPLFFFFYIQTLNLKKLNKKIILDEYFNWMYNKLKKKCEVYLKR